MPSGFSVLQQGRRPVTVALAVILLGAAVFAAIAWRYQAVLFSEARDRTERLSFLLSEQAARTFEAVDFTLRGIEPLLSSETAPNRVEIEDLLRRRAAELSFVQSIRVLDRRGQVTTASDGAALSQSDSGCLTALTAENAPSIAIGCNADDRGAGGRAAIAVARRLTDAAGQIQGVIVADLDPGYFSRFFEHLDLGRHAVVTLTENHGHILLASTRPYDQDDSARPAIVQPTEHVRLDEVERASRHQITAVHATEGYPLSVLVGIGREDVVRRWRRVMVPAFGLTCAAAVLLFALAFNLERHRAERARALQRAIVSQKLEAMGQMTASVAHDFRNVLTALGGSLHLIGKRGPDEALLAQTAATLARGNAMVNRLLAFSRRQELSLESHDVTALVTDLEATLRHIAGPGVTVALDLTDGLPLCRVDRIQFDAALMNLVVNARQAMPAGGLVALSTHAATGPASGVVVVVRDTGCGIDAATLKRVFEPFFTTKVQTGTGLGLAQVQGFMQSIGGRVTIHSSVGVGTTVSLHLPGAAIETTSRTGSPELIASDVS